MEKKSTRGLINAFLCNTSFHLIGRLANGSENESENDTYTAHGNCCSRIFRMKKYVYLIIFLVSFGWSLKSASELIDGYLAYNTVTKVEVRDLTEYELPAFTVCFKPQKDISRKHMDLFGIYGFFDENNNFPCIRQVQTIRNMFEYVNYTDCFTCNSKQLDFDAYEKAIRQINLTEYFGYQNTDRKRDYFTNGTWNNMVKQFLNENIQLKKASFRQRLLVKWYIMKDITPGRRFDFQVIVFHPPNEHFSSSSALVVPFTRGDSIKVSITSSHELPAPYSQCVNVNQEQNKELNFFADKFAYSSAACQLSCYQAHFLNKNNEYLNIFRNYSYYSTDTSKLRPGCIEGIPCNPLNKSTAFGWSLPDTNSFETNHFPAFFRNIHWSQTVEDNLRDESKSCDSACPESCSKMSYNLEYVQHVWTEHESKRNDLNDPYNWFFGRVDVDIESKVLIFSTL